MATEQLVVNVELGLVGLLHHGVNGFFLSSR